MSDGLSSTNASLAATAAVGTNAGNAQLHTGLPGSAGTANVSSTTTREAITWGTAANGVVATNGTAPKWPSWAGANGEVLSHVSTWSVATPGAGVFGLSAPITPTVTMNTGDDFTLTGLTLTIPTAS